MIPFASDEVFIIDQPMILSELIVIPVSVLKEVPERSISHLPGPSQVPSISIACEAGAMKLELNRSDANNMCRVFTRIKQSSRYYLPLCSLARQEVDTFRSA